MCFFVYFNCQAKTTKIFYSYLSDIYMDCNVDFLLEFMHQCKVVKDLQLGMISRPNCLQHELLFIGYILERRNQLVSLFRWSSRIGTLCIGFQGDDSTSFGQRIWSRQAAWSFLVTVVCPWTCTALLVADVFCNPSSYAAFFTQNKVDQLSYAMIMMMPLASGVLNLGTGIGQSTY